MIATKKRTSIIGVIVLVILTGLFVAFCTHRLRFQSPVVLLSDPTRSVVTDERTFWTNANEPITTLKEVSGGGVAEGITRDQALETYKGQVLQFDGNCRATPVTMVFPPKTVLMLDNESKWQRTIIVGPRTYTIDPYDYALATFNVTGQYGITCDSVQDVGIISIQ